jgi:hypothetical protein
LEVEKQTKQVSETAKRAALGPEGGYVGYVDLSLTREGWIQKQTTLEQLGAGQGSPGTRKRNQSNDLD